MANKNSNLHQAKRLKDDEFYTTYETIEKEISSLKTKPFLIPQNANDYLGFKSKMQDEENMLINSIL